MINLILILHSQISILILNGAQPWWTNRFGVKWQQLINFIHPHQ